MENGDKEDKRDKERELLPPSDNPHLPHFLNPKSKNLPPLIKGRNPKSKIR
jgi:hypothetical protein